jgi:GT2 family glycosyltransferase
MSTRCSIVVPVHGRAGLTRQCLDAIGAERPRTPFEIVVVDDASTDDTQAVLAGFGEAIRVVTRSENGGFAHACNDGAAASGGEYLVFLNNDTIPRDGWLDALVKVADWDPKVGAVGSKLLFPNETIQHAGVVVCQDGNPRHIYAGFPADHPAVERPRRFQAVTAASMLVRRDAFERAGGFDPAFRNCLEDTDLCMRLGTLGHEIRYCPESVLYHLESVSRGRRAKEIAANTRLFKERWGDIAERDDLRHYVEDGLLRIRYRDAYPLRIELAPELATAIDTDAGRLVERQAQQVTDLLRETVRLTAHVADLELGPGRRRAPARWRDRLLPGRSAEKAALANLVEDAERLQLDIHSFQERVTAGIEASRGADENGARPRFAPGEGLAYVELRDRIRPVVEAAVPPGATVLVVSRGDEVLLELGDRRAGHFLQEPDGTYAGRHPADSAEAIAELERLRSEGAGYLVIPAGDEWWLEHYEVFARHLDDRHEALTHRDAPCLIFRLRDA